MDRVSAKKHISETCGLGWLNLVDIIYDNKPEHISISQLYQKWAGLKVDYSGNDEDFNELIDSIYTISQKMCEKCGNSGKQVTIEDWEITLCDEHYDLSKLIQKG